MPDLPRQVEVSELVRKFLQRAGGSRTEQSDVVAGVDDDVPTFVDEEPQ